jgi:hypothetical protein
MTTSDRVNKNGSQTAAVSQQQTSTPANLSKEQYAKPRYVKFFLVSDLSEEYPRGNELVIDTTLAPKSGDVAVIRLHSSFKERPGRGEMTTASSIGNQLMRVISATRGGYRLRNVKPCSRLVSFKHAQIRDIHPVIDNRNSRDGIEQLEQIPESELTNALALVARNHSEKPVTSFHSALGSTAHGLYRFVLRAKPYSGPRIMW